MKTKFYPNSVIQSLLLIIFSFFISTPFTFPLLFLEQNKNLSPELVGTLIFIIVLTLFVSVSYYVNKKRQIRLNYLFKLVEPRYIWQMILISIIFQIGIAKPVNYFIDEFLGKEHTSQNPFNNIVFSLGAIILAPFFEEIVFRGIILRGFLLRYSHGKAILFSSLIFGIIHGRPSQIWVAIILGLFFGWIYYKTKSIGVTMLLHFAVNMSSLLVSYYEVNYVSKFFYNVYIVPAAIISLILLSLSLLKTMNTIKAVKDVETAPAKASFLIDQ